MSKLTPQLSPAADACAKHSLHVGGRIGDRARRAAHVRRACQAIALLITSLLIAACSQRESQQPASTAPTAPAQLRPTLETSALHKISSKLTAGGVVTRYDAYFDEQQLKAIMEWRESPAGEVAGEHVYIGARLIRYTGSTLPIDPQPLSNVQLKFDLQGRLESSADLDHPDRAVPDEQIGRLRTRAQLLRSHALAQRSTNQHGSGH